MLFMVVAYSQKVCGSKKFHLVDSFTSSFHYTSPFIYGGLLVGADNLYIPAYIAFFVWVMANHAFGAIQDIKPDREAGIASVATKLGASKTIVMVLAGYIIAAILPVVFYGWSALLVSVLLTPYVVMVAYTLPYRNNDTAPIFGKAWDQFLYYNYLSGFILTWALFFGFNRLPL
jgi:4-hydroxybenzoate polyprenyltransferase